MIDSNSVLYKRLSIQQWRNPRDQMQDFEQFLEPPLKSIDDLLISAWNGHIPFLFSLISLIEPRVFVELGTHYGGSFFAACQILKTQDNQQKVAIAIDSWKGDKHSRQYDETVYDGFMEILNKKYSEFAIAIREQFDQALKYFSDESIDLLHIDGCHTYEEVRNDFDLWKKKVTKDGVILIHDTTERKEDFGVWKLWEEISNEYVSFNFLHSHGLGVIIFGNNPLVPVIEYISSNLLASKLFERNFELLGCDYILKKRNQILSESVADFVQLKSSYTNACVAVDELGVKLQNEIKKNIQLVEKYDTAKKQMEIAEKESQFMQKEFLKSQSENCKIRSSFSFRIGWFISSPFRFIYERIIRKFYGI